MAVTKKERLADYGLNSERVLWRGKGPGVFEQELGDDLEDKLMLTTVEKAVAWAQGNSIWPDTLRARLLRDRDDVDRLVRATTSRASAPRSFRSSPRQADLLIVSGRVAHKMAAPLRQIYDQMLEPKWVIAMGACASSGGMFNNYAVLQGVDKIVAGRRPRARLPAAARGADRGDRAAAGEDQGGRAARLRDPRGRKLSAATRVPGLVERRDAYGETTLVVDPARARRGLHAPARRGGLQLPLAT